MVQVQDDNLLDFLAEGFLQQGASVTYSENFGIPGLKVTTEDGLSRLYLASEEKVSKMGFLEEFPSEEIIIPVLKSDEEFRLKSLLKRKGIENIKVERLSLYQRYAWYSRKLISNV